MKDTNLIEYNYDLIEPRTDDIEEIEDVLIDIHNYEKSILIDENKLIDTEVLKDLCNLKIEIYKELKEKYPDYVQEDYNCVY